jgi:hypothetical protein
VSRQFLIQDDFRLLDTITTAYNDCCKDSYRPGEIPHQKKAAASLGNLSFLFSGKQSYQVMGYEQFSLAGVICSTEIFNVLQKESEKCHDNGETWVLYSTGCNWQ